MLTAKQAKEISIKNRLHDPNLEKCLDLIKKQAEKGQTALWTTLDLETKSVEELKELGYIVSQNSTSHNETLTLILWG